jgi:hypothetical protein
MEQVLKDHPITGNPARQETPRGDGSAGRFERILCAALSGLILCVGFAFAGQSSAPDAGISKAAADSCDAKVQRLQAFVSAPNPAKKKRETKITESELNSYLELVLRPNYHPSLRSIRLKFEEARLQAIASIDFDRLELGKSPLLTGLMRKLLTGVHKLTVRGNLVSGSGKANFRLEEARFDSITLPNLLVSEIISAVGRSQNPPMDPMQPSTLPYGIERVDVHAGWILIIQ